MTDMIFDHVRAFDQTAYYHRFRALNDKDDDFYMADATESTILHSFKSCDKSTLHMIGNIDICGQEELVHLEINYLHFDYASQESCFQAIEADLVYECEQIICQDWMIVPDKCKGHVQVGKRAVQLFVDRCIEYLEQQRRKRVELSLTLDMNDTIPIYPFCSNYLPKQNACPFRRAWIPYPDWIRPVDKKLSKSMQLFTKQGFASCMMSSRYFGLPFLPSCPIVMRNLLLGIVLEKESVNLPEQCMKHISRDRFLLIVLRLLTWLERDEETIYLLMHQYIHKSRDYHLPFCAKGKDEWMYTPLDVQSWLVVLVWIAETCNARVFLMASLLCPVEYIPAIMDKLILLLGIKDKHGIVQVTQIQSCLVLTEYFQRRTYNQRLELSIIDKQSFHSILIDDTRWIERAAIEFKQGPRRADISEKIIIANVLGKMMRHEKSRSPLLRRHFISRTVKNILIMNSWAMDKVTKDALSVLLDNVKTAWCIMPDIETIVKEDRRLQFETFAARMWSMSLYSHMFDLGQCLGEREKNMIDLFAWHLIDPKQHKDFFITWVNTFVNSSKKQLELPMDTQFDTYEDCIQFITQTPAQNICDLVVSNLERRTSEAKELAEGDDLLAQYMESIRNQESLSHLIKWSNLKCGAPFTIEPMIEASEQQIKPYRMIHRAQHHV